MRGIWAQNLLPVILIALIAVASAFKAEDFKKCQDASFCNRLRGYKSDAYAIDAKSLQIEGASVTATVIDRLNDRVAYRLALTCYGDIVRLFMDEPSANPPRFQVPDVLLQSVSSLKKQWTVVKKTATKLKLATAGVDIELRFSPIQLLASVDGKPLFTWNDAQQFSIEHRREKQEGDPEGWWSESFKTHHDSKPRGPEAISWDLTFEGYNNVYGIPERATAFSLPATVAPNGTAVSEPYRLYNLDVFEYLSESPFGLYGSIPLLWAHGPHRTIGAFWLNSAEMYVDISKPEDGGAVKTQWIAESGVLDAFFLLGPTPAAGSAQYASLTGGSALPQVFALGYHQCRWNYKDQEDVSAVDAGFDAHQIPYDVLWLDIEHTDGKRYFTWDKSYFPTPAEMQDDVASRGRKMVTIVDPHIKRDSEWRVFSEAQGKGLFVKDKDGNDFDGWCWPGASSYLDYVSPDVRNWWADQFSLSQYNGSTPNLYIWNDMNEPSVFNGPEITMHKDAKHADGGAEHRDVHNAYGYFYHMATADGLRRRGYATKGSDGDRPFVLSRAFFAGSQRLGAIWTGDNGAEWAHLEVSVPMLLSIGMAGLPFSGADVGGFFGNPDAELMTRWYQVGAFYPFFRGHAHLESKRREPWLFGEETTARIRDAIRQRYKILPYVYTLFAHANVTGAPVMRPLWYEFPTEMDIASEDKVFMLGSSVLVAPVLQEGQSTVDVVLPGKTLWYDGNDGTTVDSTVAKNKRFTASAPIDTIRSYIRGGTMIPLKERPRRSSAAMSNDPITLVIALNASGAAQGDLYLDDGRSYAFQRGQYAYRKFTFTSDGTLSSVAGELQSAPGTEKLPTSKSTYKPDVLIDRIVVLGLPGGPEGWQVKKMNGKDTMDAAPGPLYLKPELSDVALVVRRAQLDARGDWSLSFERKKGVASSVAR